MCGWLLVTLRQQVVEICLPRVFRHNLIVNLFWFKHQSCGEINDSYRLKNIDKNYYVQVGAIRSVYYIIVKYYLLCNNVQDSTCYYMIIVT